MVFKPLNLARQSFVKTFTHGYAQSLVAASQSSSASQNTSFHHLSNNVTNLFSRPGTSAASQAASQSHASANAAGGLASKSGINGDAANGDGGLAAYYAAWQRHRKTEEKEPHQFQFAKRIGWKPPTTIPEARRQNESARRADAAEPSERPAVTRAKSTNDIDDLRPVAVDLISDTVVGSHAAVGQLDGASIASPALGSAVASDARSASPFDSTPPTSVSDSDAYTSRLTLLAENQQYGEIPAVFEAMLSAGAIPSSSAYNALLLAAINLPHGKHQVASRVLDVYADMLKRRVLPDTSTYAIVIELLAARALDVAAMKKELAERMTRYGATDASNTFLLRSDETEAKILAEDDSLSVAIKLFDTSAAVSTSHVFPDETYRMLVCACAEAGRVGDMVRVYADMESSGVIPPSAIYAPMIIAFANTGDLRSAVECYDEYKALAVAHDAGEITIVRKDEDVYAAVIRAYAICGKTSGGLKFLDRLEESLASSSSILSVREAVALQSLHPTWLAEDRRYEVLDHALEKLTSTALTNALSAVCIDAANKADAGVATKAFTKLRDAAGQASVADPAMALLAMHLRLGNAHAAADMWEILKSQQPNIAFVEPTVMFALPLIAAGNAAHALREARSMFALIRKHETEPSASVELSDRIEEAVEILTTSLFETTLPSFDDSLQLLRTMSENGSISKAVVERLLATIGPDHIAAAPVEDAVFLLQLQASVLLNGPAQDVAHVPRLAHLLDVVGSSRHALDASTSKLVDDCLGQLARPDLTVRWQGHQLEGATPAFSPVQMVPDMSLPAEDNFDPYASRTDFKGSSMIVDELEKPYGRHSQHLNEALTRFRNMRRAGRHPRYVTYAKLIGGAAKENQLRLAEDVLAMAKQDVPLLPHNRVVRHGWVSLLDAMVSACLTVGRRDLAAQYHQELNNIGAAPSANTFGLYITTLKGSTKTFDEATEAVKVFHRAKTEGVEPSSFLYNALIGKLGKARRIDDCLFYFAEMRNLGIRPTSVTYGTVVNALCRVSDDKFAEELFSEMESMSNYKPRPAPYNSLMQYFLTTKRDRSKVLAYYERMKASNIAPTMHTYKLLIDTHATLEPVNMLAAETVIEDMRRSGMQPEAVHFASLIHAKGCVLHDMPAARALFDEVLADDRIVPQACLYQALFESYVAHHDVAATEPLLATMKSSGVALTAYIANTLIHGWATAKDIGRARAIFDALGYDNREPSTYEAMIRANLAAEDHGHAMKTVGEALRRGYPSAVADKIAALVGGGASQQ